MIIIRNSTDLERALTGALDPPLRQLLTLRRDQLLEHDGYDFGDLAHFLIIDSGDDLASVEREAGLPLAFPAFEFVARHGDWLEAVLIVSDDGFGIALFVPVRIDIDPALLLPLLARA